MVSTVAPCAVVIALASAANQFTAAAAALPGTASRSHPGGDARITRERSIVKGECCTLRANKLFSISLTVLDANCVLHQIDFLESAGSSGAFTNVVIPQTVMNEIRGLNVSVYNRMHTLLQVRTSALPRLFSARCSSQRDVRPRRMLV